VQNAITNSGSIAAAGGFVDFFKDVSGGTATISAGGTLEYGWTSDVATTFDGAGTLKLDNQHLSQFSGTVSGFGTGDTIDLKDISYSMSATDLWNQSAGTLTISNGGVTDVIHLAGTYTQSDFALIGATGGTSGDVDVVFSPPPSITAPQSGVTASNFVTVDYPGADANTTVYGINNYGAIVGDYVVDSNHTSSFEYNGGYSFVGSSGAQDNDVDAINNSGEMGGFYSPVRSTPRYGFTDDAGTYTQVNLPGDQSTTVNGINDAGVFVGGVYFHGTPIYSGYIDNGGTITWLDASGTGSSNYYTYAEGINDADQVVGVFKTNYSSGTNQGFLYQNGTFTTIDDPNGAEGTQAYGINNTGEIVGQYTDSSGKSHGFIDVNGTFTTIDDPLGTNTTLTGINDAGQVVGFYEDSGGAYHGFVASLNGVSTPVDQALTLTSLSVSDAVAGTNPIEVTLGASHGILTVSDTANLTVSGEGTGSLSLTGTQTDIDAALANGLIYTPALNAQFVDALTMTVSDLGHNPTGVALSTTQDVGITINAANTIADSTTYTVSAPSAATIAFATGHGTLDLTQPATFTGEIAGIVGTGNVLDLSGFDAANHTVVASTGLNSYDSTTNTTSLLVTDENTSTSVTLKLAGDLSASTWNVTPDGNGGADIVDPPASGGSSAAPVAGPGPHMAIVPTVATAPTVANQVFADSSGSNTFVFDFANVGHDTVTDFHPATDVLQFGSALFTNAQAALNATQDDGHGNTVITLDAHDAITLSGILKAQLHAADFHFV
jgi:probable HAF family extracellular repeat protein